MTNTPGFLGLDFNGLFGEERETRNSIQLPQMRITGMFLPLIENLIEQVFLQCVARLKSDSNSLTMTRN